MKSPTERSLDLLRKQGYTAEVVERWIPRANVRKDLFGFIDIVAVKRGQVLGVQTTSASNLSARAKKIREHENLPAVFSSPMGVHLHGWKKKANGRYEVRILAVARDIAAAEHPFILIEHNTIG